VLIIPNQNTREVIRQLENFKENFKESNKELLHKEPQLSLTTKESKDYNNKPFQILILEGAN
jgi:hypothetical protein